ncbi:hypothetical protein OS493_008058 [Desmophyllum pertusum]|uniref:Uncharacterized protein n=1 Tax=Desmophyllum pertusum TaxID=174260 RepID=A0A9W9YGM1_9CNID|nr:hypothetical protein OS493_008058 [Desmophyllum pertusum]
MAAANSAMCEPSEPCEPQPAQTADEGTEGKVVYNQDGVFVHTAVSIATQSANIIPGRVTIIEKQNSSFVDWSPFVNEEEELSWNQVTIPSGTLSHKASRKMQVLIRRRGSPNMPFISTLQSCTPSGALTPS